MTLVFMLRTGGLCVDEFQVLRNSAAMKVSISCSIVPLSTVLCFFFVFFFFTKVKPFSFFVRRVLCYFVCIDAGIFLGRGFENWSFKKGALSFFFFFWGKSKCLARRSVSQVSSKRT